jgi:hypothetical protein
MSDSESMNDIVGAAKMEAEREKRAATATVAVDRIVILLVLMLEVMKEVDHLSNPVYR